jgi:hypothetical protein
MSRFAIVAAAIAAALALSFSALGGASGSAHRASLRVAKNLPLTVTGSHFKSHERVRVTASLSGEATIRHRVRASSAGSFSTAFTGIARCSMVRVVAVGSGGSRVTLKRLPAPACQPL